MKITAVAMISALSLSAHVALADSYKADLSVGYADFDGDASTLYANGQFFLNEVDTKGKPLAEAAFLQRASNLALSVGTTDIDGVDDNIDHVAAMGEFYVPDTMLYVAAGVVRVDGGNESDTDWVASVGVTPIDGLLITTDYDHDLGYDFNLHAKYVVALAGATALNLEAGHTNGDFTDETYLAADYYFNRQFSLGAMVEDAEDTAYTLRTNYFVNEQMYVGGSYTNTDLGDVLMVSAGMRF